MKKKTCKVLSLFLALALTVGLLGGTAMAPKAEAANSDLHGITFMGDSISTGFGLPQSTKWSDELEQAEDGSYYYSKRPLGTNVRVPGSYISIVSEALGITAGDARYASGYVFNQARPGMRMIEELRLLDPEYDAQMQSDDYSTNWVLNGYTDMTPPELQYMYDHAAEEVAKSKVVVLHLGSNDVALAVTDTAPQRLQAILDAEASGITVRALEERLKTVLENGGELSSVLLTAIGWAEAIGAVDETVAVFGSVILEAITGMFDTYAKLVERIYEINPDCTLVAVGLFNCFKDLNITDFDIFPGGKLIEPATILFNTYMQNLSPYANSDEYDYRYVDVTQINLNGFSTSLLGALLTGNSEQITMENATQVHPNAEGHQYVANQILAALGSDYSLNLPADSTPTYTVTCCKPQGGWVSPSKQASTAGDTITLTTKADNGGVASSVTVKDADGNEVAVTNQGNGVFSFVLPAKNVQVKTYFDTGLYKDVSSSDWFYEPVRYVTEKTYMSGTGDGYFSPYMTLSRAMIAQILYAMEGRPAAGSGSFSDVQDSDWYSAAVNWCAANGVVAGFEDGTFHPNDDVTREQLATMLRSYARYKGADVDSSLADLSGYADASQVSSWAVDSLRWAVGHTIMAGKPGSLLDPAGTATRAEAATMIYRLDTEVLK